MEVRAKARYIRMSPRKIRLVLDVIKGMEVEQAQDQLKFINKRAIGPVMKLLNSAIADSIHNFGLKKSNLYIKKIVADEGPTLKRWKPRALGRATPIRKRTTHISLVLAEKQPTPVKKQATPLEAPAKLEDLEKLKRQKEEKEGRAIKTEQKELKISKKRPEKEHEKEHLEQLRRREKKTIFRRIFSRKTG